MTKEQILQNVAFDLDKAKAIHEWLNCESNTDDIVHFNSDAIIEVYHNDGIDGIRVQALGEDFVISLHDLDDGRADFKYDVAMTRLQELNLSTFNRKQAEIVSIYIDQINDKLVDAGGRALEDNWYITNEPYVPREKRLSNDYNPDYTWFIFGGDGSIEPFNGSFGEFNCRPVYNFPIQN